MKALNMLKILLISTSIALLTACGGGGSSSKENVDNDSLITLSGVVYDEIVEGSTIILKDHLGNQIGEAVSNELGKYSLTFNNSQGVNSCYMLTASGGVMGGVYFTDSLTATYCGELIDINAINITPITTLIDVIAQNSSSSDLYVAHQEAKQQLIAMGMLSEGNEWNDLSSSIINYGMLSIELKLAGGVEPWIDDVIADINDQQLSSARVSNIFKYAHGGIEKIAMTDVSLFAGQSRAINITPILSEDDLPMPIAYTLLEAPEWIILNGTSITISPSTEVSTGQYSYQILATPENGSKNRINTFEVEILPSIILLEGTLDSNGGDIKNQFQDIVLTAPSGALSQLYTLLYRASIDEKGALITNLISIPEMPSSEIAQLSLSRPSSEILIQNYLQELLTPAPTQLNNQSIYIKKTATSDTKSDYDSSVCSTEEGNVWQDRNKDNFSFDQVWSCENANFLDNTSDLLVTEFTNSFVGGVPFINSNMSPNKNYNIKEKRAFVLRSNIDRLLLRQEENKIPVLFIHGFINTGKLGGFKYDESSSNDINGEYFGEFPRLISEYISEDGSNFLPFLFQWRTNVPFEVAAHHLGSAIEKITQATGKKVHIVAHSFGGILSRTLIQGLSQNNFAALNTTYDNEFVENNIASLTTVGAPHSGIFQSNDVKNIFISRSMFNNELLIFPIGVSSVVGKLTRFCESITCYQMGVITEKLSSLRKEMCGGDCSGLASGKDAWFGMHEKPGTIVHQLKKKLETDGWPAIKTQVLMGLIGDTRTGFVGAVKGDGLISLAGQRFDAAGADESTSHAYKNLLLRGGYQRFSGSDNIDEKFLGFQEFNEKFTTDTVLFRSFTDNYLAGLKGDGVFNLANLIYLEAPEGSMTEKRLIEGYNHRTGKYNKADMASEVGLQECTERPENCRHNTWQYFTSFMQELNLGDTVEKFEKISLTGRIVNLENITGIVTVIVKINGFEEARFELEGGSSTSFQQDVPFIADSEYKILFIPPMESNFRGKGLLLETQSSLNASSLEIGQTILLDEEYQEAIVILEVVEAFSGNTIDDYQLSITSSRNEGVSYSDLNLLIDGIQLAPGEYDFSISSSGYITKSKQCNAVGLSSTLCRIELVRSINDEDLGKMVAILSWQVDPRDLDTHLVKYDLSGNQQYHINYSNKNDSLTGDSLDRDDTSSYGPETLTIQNLDSEFIYVYYVHHFSGNGSITSTSLAQVDVTNFFLETEPFQANYQAPTVGNGSYWKVFEIRSGVVEPCRTNCIMDVEPTFSSGLVHNQGVTGSFFKKNVERVPDKIYQSIVFNE